MKITDVFKLLKGPIQIEKVKCASTGYAVEGPFETPALFQLNEEQFNIVESLVINGGNLKKVAEEIDVSYPTLRSRLDEIIDLLKVESARMHEKRLEILSAIEKGEITAGEGAKRLQSL